MSDDTDDWDGEVETEHLARVTERLRRNRRELARTIQALRAHRRTPEQIRAVIARSKLLIYRSLLIRRKLERHLRVH